MTDVVRTLVVDSWDSLVVETQQVRIEVLKNGGKSHCPLEQHDRLARYQTPYEWEDP